MARLYTTTIVTASDGSATAYVPSAGKVRGRLNSIQYVKAGAANYTDGVDFTITDETTGESLWTDTNINASEIVRPRAPIHSQAGAAKLYASGGEAVNDQITIVGRIKIVIGSGGDTKTGTFNILID